MPADPTAIVTAARQRRELTRAKAIKTLRELDIAGTPITFEVVARTARVSRSWLYTQPDIRTEIQRLRDETRQAPVPPIPASQRASDASTQARLRAAVERNRALAEDNQRLRRQLAHALGGTTPSPRTLQERRTEARTHPQRSHFGNDRPVPLGGQQGWTDTSRTPHSTVFDVPDQVTATIPRTSLR